MHTSMGMVNDEPSFRAGETSDLCHSMVNANDHFQFVTASDKRAQDRPGLIGHRKELAGFFALEVLKLNGSHVEA